MSHTRTAGSQVTATFSIRTFRLGGGRSSYHTTSGQTVWGMPASYGSVVDFEREVRVSWIMPPRYKAGTSVYTSGLLLRGRAVGRGLLGLMFVRIEALSCNQLNTRNISMVSYAQSKKNNMKKKNTKRVKTPPRKNERENGKKYY